MNNGIAVEEFSDEIKKSMINVDIPKHLLLSIAVYGNLGDGELPDLYKRWAEKILKEKGFGEEYSKTLDDKVKDLVGRLTNVIGKENMDKIDTVIGKAVKGFQMAKINE